MAISGLDIEHYFQHLYIDVMLLLSLVVQNSSSSLVEFVHVCANIGLNILIKH